MCLYSTYWLEWEKRNLAPYAVRSCDEGFTRRKYEEKINGAVLDPSGMRSRYRTAFQIDKDRILNSTAFRRLEYKTQMFVSHEGDHYRTRLTHTLEVADLARYIARSMRLNEDLVEAIALGHDLGHTPFGHAGEEALDEIMNKDGGDHFFHNIQGIRIVDYLESGYDWDRRGGERGGHGMNLTHAVREGILKHTNRGLKGNEEDKVSDWKKFEDLMFDAPCHLEGQVVALSDEIAQRIHDLEDGLRSGLLLKDDLMDFIKRNIGNSMEKGDKITKNDVKKILEIWHKKTEGDIDREDVEKLKKIIGVCKEGKIANLLLLDKRLSRMEKILNKELKDINSELSEDDIWNISRLIKYKQLYKEIVQKSAKIGNILAFIRGIYIGNTIENSFHNCSELLKGEVIQDKDYEDKVSLEEVRKKKMICEIIIDDKSEGKKEAKIKIFEGASEKLKHELKTMEYDIEWINKSKDIEKTQVVNVMVVEKTKKSKKRIKKCYNFPLEQVKITLIRKDLVSFTKEWSKFDTELKKIIKESMYLNYMVRRMNEKGKYFIKKLYDRFYEDPLQLHSRVWEKHFENIKSRADLENRINAIKKQPEFKQRICEHLSGMTDRYITREYERLFGSDSIIEEKDEIYY